MYFSIFLPRWNMDHTDLLPEYMKIVYGFIMSVYEDFEREAEKQQKPFLVPYFREAVRRTTFILFFFMLCYQLLDIRLLCQNG